MPGTGVYATTTLADAQQALSRRLDDNGAARWSIPECYRYLREALSTWAALTARYRATAVFASVANQPFYDLPTVLPTLRQQSTTDLDLLQIIEYHLLEPFTATVAWTGSQQFQLADVIAAIQNRRDQFLIETGGVVTHQQITVSPPPDGRIKLPEAISAVRRAAWQAYDLTVTPLLRDDVWGLNNYRQGWPQNYGQSTPRAYSVAEPPPLILQVIDPPLTTGVLDLCTINKGATCGAVVGGTPLGIPNDWAWVVKFGALADLLSRDGLALDSARAAYCEQRYQHGVQLAAAASVVWAARINNRPVSVRSVSDADVYRRSWQTGMGVPSGVLTLGQTLVALAPVPNVPAQGTYSITLDVVRNADLPALPGDFLQLDAADLDAVLDYAQHLALFKEGAQQLSASQPMLERFLRLAGVTVALDSASTPNRGALQQQTLQDQRVTLRTAPAVAAALTGEV